MRHSFFLLPLVGGLLFTALLSLGSCKKKSVPANCITAIIPDTLRFHILDIESGTDLFFSAKPFYREDQIYCQIEGVNVPVLPRISTSVQGKHFYIAIGAGTATGNIDIYIDQQRAFDLQYSMRRDLQKSCPQYLLDRLLVNHTQLETNVHGRIIPLKK